jgi:TadE-like protein
MRRSPQWIRAENGQALVEFALVTPLLLMLIIGIIEFGRAWNMSQVITDATRQGARTASILGNDVNPAVVVGDSVRFVTRRALAAGNINPDATGVLITLGIEDGGRSARVDVAVPYNFGFFGPVMRYAGEAFGADNITLRSSAVMRIEQQP